MNRLLILLFLLPSFFACSQQPNKTVNSANNNSKDTVNLVSQYSLEDRWENYYASGSDTPYSGILYSEKHRLVLELNNGKVIRRTHFNNNNDTSHTVTFKNNERYTVIDFEYVDDSLINRKEEIWTNGDDQDFSLFKKSLDLIKSKEYLQFVPKEKKEKAAKILNDPSLAKNKI